MLYNLQPDRSVTGGAWYSDQDFESEFVEVLNQQCFKFLQSKVQKTLFKQDVLCYFCPVLMSDAKHDQKLEVNVCRNAACKTKLPLLPS